MEKGTQVSIDFGLERWQKVKEDYSRWWLGDLDRPLVQFLATGRDPGRPEPRLPSHEFTAFYDLSVSAEAIVDRWDYDLSCVEFLGDAFPQVWPNFGPGVIAAFMGCELELGNGTVWFHPAHDLDIADIHFQYNPDSVWFKRIKDICQAAVDRWGGLVQIGMTDIGGNFDILSAFRPGEKLLLDLYDYPVEVKRLLWEAHEAWWTYFGEIDAILKPANPGYSSWAPLFSTEPYYMLQSDFSYMIGPDMFEKHALPELHASCKRLGNAFYHLDGPGQLPHLDLLLGLTELKGIQWVPGAGKSCDQWPEVYRKIRASGKLVHVFGTPEEMDAIVNQIGDCRGILLTGIADTQAEAARCIANYSTVESRR